MPSMMMLSDSMFPRFTDESSQGEKIEVIHNYLYKLLEQLRYTLGNLEADNFNESALDKLGSDITAELGGEVQVIRHALVGLNGTLDTAITGDGILARLESAEGSVTTLTATAAELSNRMENTDGNISEVRQTAVGLESEVESLKILTDTIDGEITTIKKSVSTFEQTAEEIELRVETIEYDIDGIEDAAVDASVAKIQAMAKEIKISVTNMNSSSTIQLTAFGVKTNAAMIKFQGTVTFDSLADDEKVTVINGAEITTGTLNSVKINGATLNMYYDNDNYGTSRVNFKWGDLDIAAIYMDYDEGAPDGNSKVYLKIATLVEADDENAVALKLESTAGLSLYGEKGIYIDSASIIKLETTDTLTLKSTDAAVRLESSSGILLNVGENTVMAFEDYIYFYGTVDFSMADVIGL